MKKVFQTIIGTADCEKGKRGNCMQATNASLFEMDLDKVPHFVEFDDWFSVYYDFIYKQGYDFIGTFSNPKRMGYWGKNRFDELKKYTGVNGVFEASVYSPGFFKPEMLLKQVSGFPMHSVLIDSDLNIVHDPNKNYEGMTKYPMHEFIGSNGICDIFVLNKRSDEEE